MIEIIRDVVKPPDFEDCSTNYFYDKAAIKAGNQLQKDAWNSAVEQITNYIDKKNMVSAEEIKTLLIK